MSENGANKKVILEDPKDREILASLLDEYANKLTLLCDKLNRTKNRTNLILTTLFLCFSSLVLILQIKFKSLIMFLESSSLLIPSILLLFIIVFILYTVYDAQRNCQFLERNARTISIKLEKVLRITSQIQDHAPRERFVARLELELRLADAESALEYYKIVNKQDYLPSFLRKFFLFKHI